MEASRALSRLVLGLVLSALMLASCGGEGTPGPEEWTPRELALLEQLESMHMYRTRSPGDLGKGIPGSVHTRGSDAWELANVMGDMQPGQHRVIYLARFGTELDLRIRVFPYPGGEAVLWRGRGSPRHTSYLLSPAFTRVAMLLRGWGPESRVELLLIPLDGGEARTIAPTEASDKWRMPQFVLWRDDDTLEILASDGNRDDWVEWVYTVATGELAFVRDVSGGWSAIGAVLEARFRGKIRTVEKAARHPLVGPLLDADLPGLYRSIPILRGTGIADFPHLSGLTGSAVAVSEDSEYLAIKTRDQPVVVVGTGGHNVGVPHPVPRSEFLSSESVSEWGLRWSPDSKHLTLTEVHHHPARFHAPDMGGDFPNPWDTTYLVRFYSPEKDEVKTIAVGCNAFLLPDVLPASHR